MPVESINGVMSPLGSKSGRLTGSLRFAASARLTPAAIRPPVATKPMPIDLRETPAAHRVGVLPTLAARKDLRAWATAGR
eukprot:CAMPEP_0170179548 /NCGR_PEP_ID=MMETSP0040_2-20121228/18276_1 /TAXON_ID=641309 /ORGANISM="Lotharella oceanica, Strain CCMP622" /LENGTH=79 /DNA_ID=CAMNT_0010423729 /DNA_START=392 /DNA_END=627 /DNA_ORIENTATION=-